MKIGSMVIILILAFSPALLAADDGAAVFKSKCAMCHGATGTGDTAMGRKLGLKPLGSPEIQKKTDDQLRTSIIKGKGRMPAWDGKLTAVQIDLVLEVVRSFAAK